MNIGEQIKKTRKEKGLSQAKLAEKSNISLKTLQRYEKGVRTPNFIILQSIANALDVNLSDLTLSSEPLPVTLNKDQANNLFQNIDFLRENGHVKTLKVEFIKDEIDFTKEEEIHAITLLRNFFKLNSDGQQRALENVGDLTKIPEYRKDNVKMNNTDYIEQMLNKAFLRYDSIADHLNSEEQWIIHNFGSKTNFLNSYMNENNIDNLYNLAKKIDETLS